MTTFESTNQFDNRFKVDGFENQRNACPLFTLFMTKKFMDDGSLDSQSYENMLEAGVMNTMTNNFLPKYMSFDELLSFTSFAGSEVQATTPELLITGIIGYEHMFAPSDTNYALMLLKNGNFMTVLIKKTTDGITYAVRDCHQTEQYDFADLVSLQEHLNKTYQFDTQTVVGGVPIPEFSQIEFIRIEQPIMLSESLDISFFSQ